MPLAIASLFAAWFVLPALPQTFASYVAVACVAAAILGVLRNSAAWRWAAVPGVVTAGMFIVTPSAFVGCAAALAALALAFALVEGLTTLRQSRRRAVDPELPLRRRTAVLLGIALGFPAALSLLLVAAGLAPVMRTTWSSALPTHPVLAFAFIGIRALIVAAAFRAREAPRPLAIVLATVAVAVLTARLAFVLSLASLDSELFWAETPLLTNALKLHAGEVLYSEPARLTSYTYSPLLDLVHHAVLRPFALDLDLFAHRALVIADQIAAAFVVTWALYPAIAKLGGAMRACAFAVLGAAALSNLVAPSLHPDHPLLLCYALAVAVVYAGERMPPRVRDALLILVTPLGVGFKLSAGGIGLALALIYAHRYLRGDPPERSERRSLVLVAVSGVLTLLTVPLFDRTLGRFSFYAITVQRSHPMEWRHFLEPNWLAFAGFTAAAIAVIAFVVRATLTAARDRQRIEELLALALAMGAASLPGAAKYAGRENNLVVLFFGLSVALVALAGAAPVRAPLTLGLALWGVLATRRPELPVNADLRAAAARSTAASARVVADDAAHGEQTLLLGIVLPWIRAGRVDVPGDRYHSAVELFFGGLPEGRLLEERIARRTYRSVILPASLGVPKAGLAQGFQERVLDAVQRTYVELPQTDGARSGNPSANPRGSSSGSSAGLRVFVRPDAFGVGR